MGTHEQLQAMREREAKLTELLNGPDVTIAELREMVSILEAEGEIGLAGALKGRWLALARRGGGNG